MAKGLAKRSGATGEVLTLRSLEGERDEVSLTQMLTIVLGADKIGKNHARRGVDMLTLGPRDQCYPVSVTLLNAALVHGALFVSASSCKSILVSARD